MIDNPSPYLLLAAVLFSIGTIGVLTRRGAITILMSIELMLNSANLALITVSRLASTGRAPTVSISPRRSSAFHS